MSGEELIFIDPKTACYPLVCMHESEWLMRITSKGTFEFNTEKFPDLAETEFAKRIITALTYHPLLQVSYYKAGFQRAIDIIEEKVKAIETTLEPCTYSIGPYYRGLSSAVQFLKEALKDDT